MKKRVLAALLAFTVSTSLLACGKKAEEPVKEEAETPVVEEAKAEPEPVVEEKKAEVVEEESEEPETDYSWVNEYIGYLNHLDYAAGFHKGALIYVNDDLIPEIILQSYSDEDFIDYSSYMGLTINENEVEELELYGNHDGLKYIPKENAVYLSYFVLQGGYETDTVYSIQNGKWQEIFNGENGAGPDPEGAVSYYIDETEVSEKDYVSQRNTVFDTNKAETIEFTKSIDELKAELTKLREEADAEQYKDVEPWKLAYRNLLYDFIGGKKISEYEDSYNEDSKFIIKDINNDNIQELLINPFSDRWYAYSADSKSLEDSLICFCGIVEETGEFIGASGDEYNVGFCGSIGTLDGKSISLYDEDWEDTVWDEATGEIKTTYPHLYTIIEQDIGRDPISREASSEEAKIILDKVRKYTGNVGESIKLTPENVDKVLGLSSGSTESNESKQESKKSDNSLCTVEVTAPDGYVNFRTGAGTDYEIISPISNGEILSVISDEGKWLQVEYQGKTGWVASSQVTKK